MDVNGEVRFAQGQRVLCPFVGICLYVVCLIRIDDGRWRK